MFKLSNYTHAIIAKLGRTLGIPNDELLRMYERDIRTRILLMGGFRRYPFQKDFNQFLLRFLEGRIAVELHSLLIRYFCITSYSDFLYAKRERVDSNYVAQSELFLPEVREVYEQFIRRPSKRVILTHEEYIVKSISIEDEDLLNGYLMSKYFPRWLRNGLLVSHGLPEVSRFLDFSLLEIEKIYSDEMLIFATAYNYDYDEDDSTLQIFKEMLRIDVEEGEISLMTLVPAFPKCKKILTSIHPLEKFIFYTKYYGIYNCLFDLYKIPLTSENVKNRNELLMYKLPFFTTNSRTEKFESDPRLYSSMGSPPRGRSLLRSAYPLELRTPAEIRRSRVRDTEDDEKNDPRRE